MPTLTDYARWRNNWARDTWHEQGSLCELHVISSIAIIRIDSSTGHIVDHNDCSLREITDFIKWWKETHG